MVGPKIGHDLQKLATTEQRPRNGCVDQIDVHLVIRAIAHDVAIGSAVLLNRVDVGGQRRHLQAGIVRALHQIDKEVAGIVIDAFIG